MKTTLKSAKNSPLDTAHFKAALSQFATGVTIITTRSAEGDFIGITVSSFNSVSLTPPLVLWSLSTQSASLPHFLANNHYVINVLSAEQKEVALQFSRPVEDRFSGVDFQLSATGLPILTGAAAWFECQNRSRYPEGDHMIFVGEVLCCDDHAQEPLIFHNGKLLGA